MDDVFNLEGIPPTFPAPRDVNSTPIPQYDVDRVKDFYMQEYAPGLDRFFETVWYTTEGLTHLVSDQDLLHFFVHCIYRFRSPPSEHRGLPSLEARLIWLLATMPHKTTAPSSQAIDSLPQPPPPKSSPSPLAMSVLPRLDAIAHLILGTFLPPDRVPPPPTHAPDPKTQPEAYTYYLCDLFWHHLASFLAVRDDDSQAPSSGSEIATQLAGMRNILSMLENRDVIYSMAIARHFGGRMERYETDKVLVGRGNGDQEDPINKLVVAMGFLANEELQGTTQIVQRLCGMSRRGFVLQRDIQPTVPRETGEGNPAA